MPVDVSTRSDLARLLPPLVQMVLDYSGALESTTTLVVEHLPPVVLQEALGITLGPEQSMDAVFDAVKKTLRYSPRTGHPRFFNQLYGGVDAAGILGEWVTALVNSSMYTYEVAPVATLAELALIERMNQLVGFPDGEGIFSPGGSIANLMALLAARHRAFPEAKRDGVRGSGEPIVFLSDEAHYSTPRAASVAGFGTNAAVTVPTDPVGRMIPEALAEAITQARREGKTPFMVVATSGTTVPCAFDPIGAIADVTEPEGLWLHVDASFGGGVLFSDRHRHLMAGVERADSVTWNPHKMMGLPLACSAILVREKGVLEATNGMHADYLFHGADGPTCDLGDMSLQCGRRIDALKLWFSWIALGDAGYAGRVERLFDLVRLFRTQVEDRPGFRVIRDPEGTTLCFRYLPKADRGLDHANQERREHAVTLEVRRRLLESGRFMINYATLDGAATFRIVMNNPRTAEQDLTALLDAIEEYGETMGG